LCHFTNAEVCLPCFPEEFEESENHFVPMSSLIAGNFIDEVSSLFFVLYELDEGVKVESNGAGEGMRKVRIRRGGSGFFWFDCFFPTIFFQARDLCIFIVLSHFFFCCPTFLSLRRTCIIFFVVADDNNKLPSSISTVSVISAVCRTDMVDLGAGWCGVKFQGRVSYKRIVVRMTW
jgi:hypothetical protein